MATLAERSRAVAVRLEAAGINPAEARLDAEVLIRDILGWDRARYLADGQAPAPARLDERLESLVARRAAREPMAYIRGHCEFWGREFEVTSAVLIPRPETELVVEAALAALDASQALVIDVGTGSGCLAVTLALERPRWRVFGSDISDGALTVARRNAHRHGVSERVVLEHRPLLGAAGAGRPDLIVSNPPYVSERERDTLAPEVRQEPEDALFAGEDGLDVIRALEREAASQLAAGGRLIFEFGFGQQQEVSELLRAGGWTQVDILRDLQGIPRTAVARRD